MARFNGKVDANQGAICDALRAKGAQVWSLASMGNGFPDLLVRVPGMGARAWFLLEVKRPGGKLTDSQVRWHANNPGVAQVVTSEAEAVALVFGGD
jgi:hypothetical protein